MNRNGGSRDPVLLIEAAEGREDIRFALEILAVTDQWGIAHWHGSYTRVDGTTRLELDGILLVSLDDNGRCRVFREWSNRRQLHAR